MRLAPVVLHFHPDRQAVVRHAAESSRTTHGTPEAVAACELLGRILHSLLSHEVREVAVVLPDEAERMPGRLRSIAEGDYRAKPVSEIRGTGYVVDSLEAALWCFWHSDNFEEAVLRAANLGDDADTTAAICGQLAGAHWGESGIPRHWIDRVAMGEEIRGLADALIAAGR
jgi:ADP-ribosyl-[dinitrogen reductase] hydrolase